MAVVVFLGFHDVQGGGVNFATRLTWTIWWADIIFTFFLLQAIREMFASKGSMACEANLLAFRLGREAAGAGPCARSSSG